MTTKEKVLEILSQNKEKSISGEKLAKTCNVSRAAIWKAINSLREQNCQIEGTTNGGYILHGNADIFSKEIFQKELEKSYPQFLKSHIECFKEIDSTNSYAKKVLIECGNLQNSEGIFSESWKKYHNSIFVAEKQTAGRGRLGRTFVSPAKTGIYLSVIYAPKRGILEPAKITAFSAVAVCRVIEKLYDVKPKIKWINDIYIDGKKICGILTEGFTNFETGIIESAIIGIGINIFDNPEIFDANKIAGSIIGNKNSSKKNFQNKKSIPTRCCLAANVAGEILKILEENQENLIEIYKNLSCTIGQTVKVHPIIGDDKSSYIAKAIDIDKNAALIVQLKDGTTKALNSGEVTFHHSN